MRVQNLGKLASNLSLATTHQKLAGNTLSGTANIQPHLYDLLKYNYRRSVFHALTSLRYNPFSSAAWFSAATGLWRLGYSELCLLCLGHIHKLLPVDSNQQCTVFLPEKFSSSDQTRYNTRLVWRRTRFGTNEVNSDVGKIDKIMNKDIYTNSGCITNTSTRHKKSTVNRNIEYHRISKVVNARYSNLTLTQIHFKLRLRQFLKRLRCVDLIRTQLQLNGRMEHTGNGKINIKTTQMKNITVLERFSQMTNFTKLERIIFAANVLNLKVLCHISQGDYRMVLPHATRFYTYMERGIRDFRICSSSIDRHVLLLRYEASVSLAKTLCDSYLSLAKETENPYWVDYVELNQICDCIRENLSNLLLGTEDKIETNSLTGFGNQEDVSLLPNVKPPNQDISLLKKEENDYTWRMPDLKSLMILEKSISNRKGEDLLSIIWDSGLTVARCAEKYANKANSHKREAHVLSLKAKYFLHKKQFDEVIKLTTRALLLDIHAGASFSSTSPFLYNPTNESEIAKDNELCHSALIMRLIAYQKTGKDIEAMDSLILFEKLRIMMGASNGHRCSIPVQSLTKITRKPFINQRERSSSWGRSEMEKERLKIKMENKKQRIPKLHL